MQPPSSNLRTRSLRFIRRTTRPLCEFPESPHLSGPGKDHGGSSEVPLTIHLESSNLGTPRNSRATCLGPASGHNEQCSWLHCTGLEEMRNQGYAQLTV